MYLESYPRDNDPYCPGKLNYFMSHYNRIGATPDEPLQSETSRMLTERFEKRGPITEPNRYLTNFYSYSECVYWKWQNFFWIVFCSDTKPKESATCPADISPDYITTMQNSYTMPFPYKMQRVKLFVFLEKIIFLVCSLPCLKPPRNTASSSANPLKTSDMVNSLTTVSCRPQSVWSVSKSHSGFLTILVRRCTQTVLRCRRNKGNAISWSTNNFISFWSDLQIKAWKKPGFLSVSNERKQLHLDLIYFF